MLVDIYIQCLLGGATPLTYRWGLKYHVYMQKTPHTRFEYMGFRFVLYIYMISLYIKIIYTGGVNVGSICLTPTLLRLHDLHAITQLPISWPILFSNLSIVAISSLYKIYCIGLIQ